MTGNPWRGTGPELITAAIIVAAAGTAALAVAGWPGLVVVAAGAAALSVVVIRGLSPRAADQAVRTAAAKPAARAITGYAQRRFVVASGISNAGFYEAELRPALEHLLAARLAERHDVNLYTEPEAARAAFCATRADEALWPWIDPAAKATRTARATGTPGATRAPSTAGNARPGGSGSGIPRRTLARLIDRLEHL